VCLGGRLAGRAGVWCVVAGGGGRRWELLLSCDWPRLLLPAKNTQQTHTKRPPATKQTKHTRNVLDDAGDGPCTTQKTGASLDAAAALLQEQLDDLAAAGPSGAELNRVKRAARVSLLSGLQSNAGMAATLAAVSRL
jgi:hypothetical protein